VKLVHLVGFIIKKFVTMQRGHTNVKFATVLVHILTEQRNLLVSVALINAAQRNVDCRKKKFTCVMMTDRLIEAQHLPQPDGFVELFS
jgi:hypothetical protein